MRPALFILMLLAHAPLRAQAVTGRDGDIISRVACATPATTPPPSPDSLLLRAAACERITYWSDGLRVVALLTRPAGVVQRPMPLVIFNHGNTAARGALAERVSGWQARLVARGYLVLSPQYRGGGGSEGQDEFGGADVDDVLNLFPVARALGIVDMRNLFMHGHSRGGTMTYLAIKAGAPLRAAVASSAVADFGARSRFTPWVKDSVDRPLMPDFEHREAEHYRTRSAVEWPERLSVPLLIVHGTADDRVPVASAVDLATRLKKLGQPAELVLFEGDGHDMPAHRPELERRIADWFDAHLVR